MEIDNFQVHVVLFILYLSYAYLFIGVACGTASKCVLLGTGATVVGFATFGFNKLVESFKLEVVMPLYFSSFPYSNS